MKRKTWISVLVMLLLISLAGTALASTYYHKPSDYKGRNYLVDGGSYMWIPYGAKVNITTDKWGNTMVSYGGRSADITSFANFSKTPPTDEEMAKAQEIAASGGTKTAAVAPSKSPTTGGQGDKNVNCLGAVVQFADKNGKGTGTKYNEILFDGSVDVLITANSYNGKKLKGWIINGIEVQSASVSKTLLLKDLDGSVLVEAVFK